MLIGTKELLAITASNHHAIELPFDECQTLALPGVVSCCFSCTGRVWRGHFRQPTDRGIFPPTPHKRPPSRFPLMIPHVADHPPPPLERLVDPIKAIVRRRIKRRPFPRHSLLNDIHSSRLLSGVNREHIKNVNPLHSSRFPLPRHEQ
ncbi:hypothetical protein CEXT_230371 [Caerostris extrusa]|uniref:Uncharacterized protein n=1 Tax=Caerostris extrusa TaxID=172846 RepID=A0AAV4U9S4_CAEEX|nr:hypothetical protein CEXT_230371 [Caerostris extrusa]